MPLPLVLIGLLGAAAVGAVAVAAAASSSSSSASSSVKADGKPFGEGSDYSDPLLEEIGKLKDAGEQKRAKDEAESTKNFGTWGSLVGGNEGRSLAEDMWKFGLWISHLVYGDEYDKANTDDQKARLTADVAQIVKMGFPPAGLVESQDFGARDVADRIEGMFKAMKAVGDESIPVAHGVPAEIGRAVIYAAVNGEPEVRNTILNIFKKYASRGLPKIGKEISVGTTIWTRGGAPTYLWFPQNGRPFSPGDRPEIDYVAAAAAGLYGAPLPDALKTAYGALNTYASRRGFTKYQDFAMGFPDSARDPHVSKDLAAWLAAWGQADSIVDAWLSLKGRYDIDFRKQFSNHQKDQAADIGSALVGTKLTHL